MEERAVLEEAADDRAHADVLGQPGDAGPQAAEAAHDEVDRHAGLRGLARALRRSGRSSSWFILTTMRAGRPACAMLGLALDQRR